MRVAVVGSRKFDDYDMMKSYLDKLHSMRKIELIVSGGASGADSFAVHWAKSNSVEYLVHEAKWDDLTHPDARIKVNSRGKKYDANAGFRRNRDIVNDAQVVLAFWDGNSPGTKDSIDYARSINKPIRVIRY